MTNFVLGAGYLYVLHLDFPVTNPENCSSIYRYLPEYLRAKTNVLFGLGRRLTMNLFGNSLKYTHDGYITVKLEAQTISESTAVKNHDIGKTLVTLTISDTGRGMSTDFMKTKLFTPFSQV
jgi:hypothetical protein